MNHSQTLQSRAIRPKTVKLIARLIRPLTEENLIYVSEEKEIIINLKHLAEKGELMPTITPKLIDMREAAEMLGLGLSNFKKIEKEGAFPFKRRMLGSSVRYLNVSIIEYIINSEEYK